MKNTKPLSSKELIRAKKRSVFLFLLWQFAFSVLIAFMLFFTNDHVDAYSFFIGSMVSILPSFYMAIRIFGSSKIRTAQEIVKSFYKGEAGKIVLTAFLLALVFVFVKPLSVSLFFTGFGIIILSHWLSPVVIK